MRYRELARSLRKQGCEFLRQAGGSHEIWWRPGTDMRTVIPCYPSREIPPGTLRSSTTWASLCLYRNSGRRPSQETLSQMFASSHHVLPNELDG
jgi:predicted RNA binding protein YcfA (HicA-like mRNA interferase family)